MTPKKVSTEDVTYGKVLACLTQLTHKSAGTFKVTHKSAGVLKESETENGKVFSTHFEYQLIEALLFSCFFSYIFYKHWVLFQVVYAEKPTDTRFPEDVVGPGVCYRPATLEDLEENQYYEMHVSNVISPGLFWVQKRKDLLALETLMDGLEWVGRFFWWLIRDI